MSVKLLTRGSTTTAIRSASWSVADPRTRSRSASESSESSQSPGSHGSTPSTGRPVSRSSVSRPGRSRPTSPRNLLTTNPATSAWSSASSSASVPCMAANTPPRSMSPTSTVGMRAVPGEPHVDEVVRPQVDLGGAAGPLADDDVVAGGELVVRRERRLGQGGPPAGERRGVERPRRPPTHHHVAAQVAAGLEQHRVHRGLGLGAGREGLHPLRTADLGPVGGDHGVVGHVLRLERRDVHAATAQCPAQPGGDDRLAGVRGGAGDEEAAHAAQGTRSASSPSTRVLISSRIGRTASRPWPAGSSRSQSS